MAQEYTLSELRIEVAENVGYDDGAGNVQSGKDLTAAMIDKYINRRYYEVLNLLIESYPEDYTRIATADFFKAQSTVSSITDDTLVAGGSIFVNGMVGDTVYNSTKSETAVIESYTNGTTVVLTTEPDWDAADVIYVLGYEFVLGGDAADAKYPLSVAVRYDASWDDARTCRWISQTKATETGLEIYSQYQPVVYKTSAKVGGVMKKAIGVLPAPTTPVTKAQGGLELRYVEMPDRMSGDSDMPQLPLGTHHYLITGATIDALRKLRRLEETSEYARDWGIALPMIVKTYARSRVQNVQGRKTNINDFRFRTR